MQRSHLLPLQISTNHPNLNLLRTDYPGNSSHMHLSASWNPSHSITLCTPSPQHIPPQFVHDNATSVHCRCPPLQFLVVFTGLVLLQRLKARFPSDPFAHHYNPWLYSWDSFFYSNSGRDLCWILSPITATLSCIHWTRSFTASQGAISVRSVLRS